jgi:hypothetical protein
LHNGAQRIAFDALNRLGLCEIKLFAAQYPTPHDCCVRFATVVAGGPATLARGRLATALPPPDFHRLESASFAWRTGSRVLALIRLTVALLLLAACTTRAPSCKVGSLVPMNAGQWTPLPVDLRR